MNIENAEIKKETIRIKAGTMLYSGPEADGECWVVERGLEAIVLKDHPRFIEVIIPELNREFRKKYIVRDFELQDQVFYVHKPY